MAAQGTGAGGLAGRYAAALFDLADSNKALDDVAGELGELKAAILGSEDLIRMIRSPVFGRDEQSRAMMAILEKAGASDLTRRFVMVVARNRRLFALPRMIDAYLAELASRRGEMTAEVTAATKLTGEQEQALTEALRRIEGGKVKIDVKVDPRLLGGLTVRVGSRMIDSSLRTKLAKLQFVMKGVG